MKKKQRTIHFAIESGIHPPGDVARETLPIFGIAKALTSVWILHESAEILATLAHQSNGSTATWVKKDSACDNDLECPEDVYFAPARGIHYGARSVLAQWSV